MHTPVLRLVGKTPLLLQIVHHLPAAAGFKGTVDGILRTAEYDPVENLVLGLPSHADGLGAEDDADACVTDFLEQRQQPCRTFRRQSSAAVAGGLQHVLVLVDDDDGAL